jgi:trimethylamine---corrinoid protein Co-methyltransferase
MSDRPVRRSRTSRAQRDGRRARTADIPQLPWRNLRNRLPPTQILSADQIEAIHHASLTVLRDAGIKVLSARARSVFAQAGAQVDEATQMVCLDPELVEASVALAPAEFEIAARNASRSITLGGNHINFNLVGGPSFVSDLDGGRRTPTHEDFRNFMRLAHSLNVLHLGGSAPVAPMDLPAPSRHLDMYYGAITLHDKVWSANLLGTSRARDALEMAAIVHGVPLERLVDRPVLISNINTNSPRQLDASMSDGLTEMVTHGQPVTVTPFTLLGAMAPVTIAGALVQQNAEALFGITLCQLIRAGAPVVYGGFTSNVDMKSGAPAFGTPEYAKATQAGAQLARRYGLPFRSSSTNAANSVDAQAAYESEMSIWAAVMGHANLMHHACGWLEGGLTASFEKMIVDAEMLQMMTQYLEPVAVDTESLAVDAIAQVPPGAHFFGSPHTLERYDTAFYEPIVSDWRNFESWAEAGSLGAAEHANRVYKQMLSDYEQPPLDAAIVEELNAFMARRKIEISTDGVGGEGYS